MEVKEGERRGGARGAEERRGEKQASVVSP